MEHWNYRHPSAVIGSPPEHRNWISGIDQDHSHPIIHPTARINAFVTVDCGLDSLGKTTTIGAYTLLMAHVHVGHNAQVGDRCELAPGAALAGNVILGNGVKVGLNASIKPFVKVGAGARIGMGAVVLEDVPSSAVMVGNPARRIS